MPTLSRQAVALRREKRAGFTLLEVVFAMGMLGFGLLGLFMLHNVAIGSNKHASRLTTCMMLAQHQMEYLMGLPLGMDEVPSGDLEITNADLTTASDPYAYFAHPDPDDMVAPAPINAAGTTSAADGTLSYYLTWDVSYPIDGDTTILKLMVRVIFFEKGNGRPHGVTISSFRYVDTYSSGSSTSSSGDDDAAAP